MTIFTIKHIEEIDRVAADFLQHYPNQRILALRGEMGIGKTTFIKALCHVLGVKDTVNSPSFAIVNEYKTANQQTIYHFDFYRLKNIEEAFDLGYEDYMYSGAYCMMEWPDKIEALLPPNRLELQLSELPDGARIIQVEEKQ